MPDITGIIKRFLGRFGGLARSKATARIEYELHEMEFAFAQILFSSFIGLPTLPEHIALEILPCMEEELACLDQRIASSDDQLAELFGKLGFE